MTEETQAPTKVFISYSCDSEDHKEHVVALANTLRDPWGIETDIDQYIRAKYPYTPEQGWDVWMEKRIEWAEFVLIVCTETYKRRFRGDEEPGVGRGVTWEGTIIRQHLYNDQLVNTKFIPVVFSSQDLTHVPIILNGNDKYILEDEKSFKELIYRLRKEPIVAMPEVATAKLQAPPEPKFFSPQKPPTEPPPVFLQLAPPHNQMSEATQGDYAQLEALMKAGKWQEADQETAQQMCLVMGRQSEGWLRVEDIEKFPCADLRAIDQLWVQHSNGKFGFSVQKKIWQQCGSPTEYNEQWEKFGEAVGWRSWNGNRSKMERKLSIFDRNFDPSSAPEGYLPSLPSEIPHFFPISFPVSFHGCGFGFDGQFARGGLGWGREDVFGVGCFGVFYFFRAKMCKL